jgi:2-polyprenyl-6-methoxyphenol hydroxylase-like FAD-dependent oxidoreductase
MANKFYVGIVGYGIAGIAAAIYFRSQGHVIAHFDRNKSPQATGAGMLLHPPAIRQLEHLGISTSNLKYGAPVRRICAQTSKGRRLINFNYEDVALGHVGLGIQRSTLHQLLSRQDTGRDQLTSDCKIVSIDARAGYIWEENGNRHGPFDIIVGADGTNSLIRERMRMPKRHDQYYESAAVVGLLNDPEGFAGDSLSQYFDGARHLSVWPVGYSVEGGQQQCSIAINVPVADAEALLERGIWREMAVSLCPRIENLISNQGDNSKMHIFSYRDTELDCAASGRVVLIGDAAHSMSPQLGNGAQLAMEDAAILSEFINRNPDVCGALQEFSRARLSQLRPFHRASRWITPIFQSDSRMLAMFRDNMIAGAMSSPALKRIVQSLLI